MAYRVISSSRAKGVPGGFRVITADPPWRANDQLGGKTRGASAHYRTMTFMELAQFQLPPTEDDCVLFLWRMASMQDEASDLLTAWDFKLKTEMVWVKKTKHGKRWFGMGRYVRGEHETVLIATRGKPQRLSKSVRSVFEAPAGRHSEKPEEFYRIVETLYAGPYVELFARRQREGWTCLGDEVGA